MEAPILISARQIHYCHHESRADWEDSWKLGVQGPRDGVFAIAGEGSEGMQTFSDLVGVVILTTM